MTRAQQISEKIDRVLEGKGSLALAGGVAAGTLWAGKKALDVAKKGLEARDKAIQAIGGSN